MSEETERDVIERMLPDLAAEGYDVFVHPKKWATPTFLVNTDQIYWRDAQIEISPSKSRAGEQTPTWASTLWPSLSPRKKLGI